MNQFLSESLELREAQEQLRELRLSLEWKNILLKNQDVTIAALKNEVTRVIQQHHDAVNWIHNERMYICDALGDHDLLLIPHGEKKYRIVSRSRVSHHYQLNLFDD